jgi:hypothetical protein
MDPLILKILCFVLFVLQNVYTDCITTRQNKGELAMVGIPAKGSPLVERAEDPKFT